MGCILDYLITGSKARRLPLITSIDNINSDTKIICNLIRCMGLYEELSDDQKELLKHEYQDIGFIDGKKIWNMEEREIKFRLGQFMIIIKDVLDDDVIMKFFLYVKEHQLHLIACGSLNINI
jgi:hypothetical protein